MGEFDESYVSVSLEYQMYFDYLEKRNMGIF